MNIFIVDGILCLRMLLFILFSLAKAQTGPECPQKCICDYYAQVHTIDCSSQMFEELPSNIPTWSTSLTFDGNFLSQLNLSSFKTTTYFEKFRIRYNEINNIVIGDVSGREEGLRGGCARVGRLFPRLNEVNLRGNELQTLPKCLLSVWPVLKVLNLNENDFDNFVDLNMVGHVHYYDSLEELYLRRNSLSRLTKTDLYSPANALRNVKIIDLSENMIKNLETGIFMFLSELRNIRLNGNQLRSIPEYAFVTQGQQIENIQLNQNLIDHIASNAFAGLPRLDRLDLSNNNFKCFNSRHLSTCPPVIGGRFVEPAMISKDLLEAKHTYKAMVNLDSLQELIMEGNPFKCDCSFKKFAYSNATNNMLMSLRRAACATPEHFENLQIPRAMELLENCSL